MNYQQLVENMSPEVAELNDKQLSDLRRLDGDTAVSSEHDMQCALFAWIDTHMSIYPELASAFAVPNGGHRHPAVALRMKAEGVRPGVPDVLLLRPSADGLYHGAAWELKVGSNRTSQAQRDWGKLLSAAGYRFTVIWDDWKLVANDMLQFLGYEDRI